MRIAVISGHFPALSQTFVLDQVVGLLELGHDLRIIGHGVSRDAIEHEAVARYRLRERLDVLSVSPEEQPRALRECLSRHVPDVVIAHFGPNAEVAAEAMQLGFDRPLVTMLHGYDVRAIIEQGPGIYPALFERSERILAISEWAIASLRAAGVSAERLTLHPVGIDPRRFADAGAPGPGRPTPPPVVVLTVARLHPIKGHAHALRALSMLMDAHPELFIEYRIAGTGKLEHELHRLVAELGLRDQVVFLGPLTAAQVTRELQAAHVFLLPSLAEGLPVALMEAQAAGLPVVATDVGAVASLVTDARSGYLAPPGDAEALATCLGRLIRDPDSWSEIGRRARRDVLARYDIRRLNRGLEQICRELSSPRGTVFDFAS